MSGLARVGPDHVVRTYCVRAPLDWALYAREQFDLDPAWPGLPLLFFLSGAEPIALNADGLVQIGKLFAGVGSANWATDPFFDPLAPAEAAELWPKCVAVFVDQPNPVEDVEIAGGKGFDSGSIGSGSAALWQLDDIGAISSILGEVKAEFDAAIAALTGGAVTVGVDPGRVFGCGHSDGGYMCVRLLQESTDGGRLAGTDHALRGVYCSGTGVGGILFNDPDHTRFGGTIGWNAVPYGTAATSPKVMMLVHGAFVPTATEHGDLQELGTESASIADRFDLQYAFQAANADQVQFNDSADQAVGGLDPGYSTGYYGGTHSIMARMDHSVLASGNAWADAYDSGPTPTSFPSVTSPGIPSYNFGGTVDQYDRGVLAPDSWYVRVWDVEDMQHVWPQYPAQPFDSVVVAWLYFRDYAL